MEHHPVAVPMKRPLSAKIRDAIRDRAYWPGGYPFVGILDTGQPICCACMEEELETILRSTSKHLRDGWCVESVTYLSEDDHGWCIKCKEQIR